MWQISAGLGLVLALTLGAFKLYYDKSQSELDAFQIRLEQSIQNQKTLESTIEEQNDNLKQTIKNHDLLLTQVERLQRQNMEAQNEVTRIKKKFSEHDLNVLSMRKPLLVEKIVNKATRKVGEELEQITSGVNSTSS